MIYISNSLYLSGSISSGIEPNNPIIGYHSILLPDDIDATSGLTGRVAINMWSPDTATFWQGLSFTSVSPTTETQYIVLSNLNAYEFDYIGIARHNLGSSGFTFSIEESSDAGATWSEIVAPKIFSDDSAILEYFDMRSTGLVRIKLTKTSTLIPAPIIAHIKMGRALVLQRRIYVGHAPGTIGKKVRRIINTSESGQYLGQIILSKAHASSCTQQNNTAAFVREKIKPFIQHVNGEVEVNGTAPATFFFAWRPGDYPEEVLYGWTGDDIRPENQLSNGMMSWSFNMEAVA